MKPFHIYLDASNHQLGDTLVEEGQSLGLSLNSSQLNYTVREKELLRIVQRIISFDGMIRGFDLVIHNDHLNLLYNNLPNQQMIRWRLLLEEFHAQVKDISGNDNLSYDSILTLDVESRAFDVIKWEPPHHKLW